MVLEFYQLKVNKECDVEGLWDRFQFNTSADFVIFARHQEKRKELPVIYIPKKNGDMISFRNDDIKHVDYFENKIGFTLSIIPNCSSSSKLCLP